MPTGMAWNWRLRRCLVLIRPASDGSPAARWAWTSGLRRGESVWSLHAAQRHPSSRWQRSLWRGVGDGGRGPGGFSPDPPRAHGSWAAATALGGRLCLRQRDVPHHPCPQAGVGGQHAMKADQVQPRPRCPRDLPLGLDLAAHDADAPVLHRGAHDVDLLAFRATSRRYRFWPANSVNGLPATCH